MAQGDSRPGTVIVPLTVNKALLEAFDQLSTPQRRSRNIEKLMQRAVLQKRLQDQVRTEDLDAMLAMVE